MKISVMGLGKLGLPLACVLAKFHKVVGIDEKWLHVEHMRNGRCPIKETDLDHLFNRVKHNINFTTEKKDFGEMTFIVVPTPSDPENKFDSQYVENALEVLPDGHIAVIVSTLMPGETDRLQKQFPTLKILYSPTFIALGSVIKDFTEPKVILIGSNDHSASIKLRMVYWSILLSDPKILLLTPLEAEIVKLAINCYCTTKITFANQIGNLCHKLGLKGDRVCEAIGQDPRVGTMYLRPGLGYGGPCFPRDNKAMSAFIEDVGNNPCFFKTVDYMNRKQIKEFVNRVKEKNPKTVGFASMSYKPGTDNKDCSQLEEVARRLFDDGYKIVDGVGEVNVDWWEVI